MCWGIFAIHNLGAYISVILLFEYSACKYTRADDMLYAVSKGWTDTYYVQCMQDIWYLEDKKWCNIDIFCTIDLMAIDIYQEIY